MPDISPSKPEEGRLESISPNPTNTAEPIFATSQVLFGRAWELFKLQWQKLIVVALAPIVLATLSGYVTPSPYTSDFWIVSIIAIAIIAIICSLAQIFIIDKAKEGVTIKEALGQAMRVSWRFLGLAILTAFFSLIAYLFLFFPGIIVTVFLLPAIYLLVLEKQKVFQSIENSFRLVKGFWWTIFARLLIFYFVIVGLMIIVGMVVGIPIELLEESANTQVAMVSATILQVLVVVIQSFVGIFALVYNYILFKELKRVKQERGIARDGVAIGKKVGLGVVIGLLTVIVGVMIAISIFNANQLGKIILSSDPTSFSDEQDLVEIFEFLGQEPNEDMYASGYELGYEHGLDGDGEFISQDDDFSYLLGYGSGYIQACLERGEIQETCEEELSALLE